MKGLLNVFRCPYCPRSGVGNVAIDPDRAIDLAAADSGSFEVNVAGADPNGVLVFDPDGSGHGPCPHVVSLLIDVEVGPRSLVTDRNPVTYTCNFDRAEFSEDPLGEALSHHLWLEVNGGDQRAFHPTTPHMIVLPTKRRRKSSNLKIEIRVDGTVFVAMDPDTFMTQLRETHLAHEVFHAKARR